ncbi:energy transducer TonB [Aquimarina sp. 2201CG14-23]|uniref:energy transducer TonB n=1 Tax=Aquimarina mycalae TaxID=3040073 RepID=UPI002477CD21|nr:energy transducer TonB [Aquimarina sp. 2201CG14-23]MDH7445365.1 energy transducer TonB [Aquimarina sp. 2201CG14-23]
MSNKHEANVRKGTLVNFQIGLIASLLFTYVMFEVYTSKPVEKPDEDSFVVEDESFIWNGEFEVYQEPEQKVIAQKKPEPVPDPEEFDVVEDDAVIDEVTDEFKSEEPVESTPFNPDAIHDKEDEEVPENVPFSVVEDVPIFPGCEKLKSNKERAACFSEKISKIISRKFNTDIGSEYGLNGVQRIYTLFDVSADGTIQNIQVRAPHPKLKKEAERVIGLFPKMTPGKQRKIPVTVKYQLPIVFKVQD